MAKTFVRVSVASIVAGAVGILLAGCNGPMSGPTIDATNATTLSKSIQTITAEMPEAQRLLLMSDLNVIQKNAQGEAFKTTRDLYPDSGGRLSNYSELALTLGTTIHNKTPDQVHTLANSIRREQTIRLLGELIADIEVEELQTTKQISCTRRAMDPAVNQYGYSAIGWQMTLTDCQARLPALKTIREGVQLRKQEAETFDFSNTTVEDAMDGNARDELRELMRATGDCRPNIAFCPP